jgi:hypothetical protein
MPLSCMGCPTKRGERGRGAGDGAILIHQLSVRTPARKGSNGEKPVVVLPVRDVPWILCRRACAATPRARQANNARTHAPGRLWATAAGSQDGDSFGPGRTKRKRARTGQPASGGKERNTRCLPARLLRGRTTRLGSSALRGTRGGTLP